MFYCKNNLLPPLFLNLFVTNSQIHNNGTRTANNIKHIKGEAQTSEKKIKTVYIE